MSCPMPAWSSAARSGVPSPAGSMPSRCATRSSGSIDMKNSGPTGFPVLPHSWRKSHGNPNRHETESLVVRVPFILVVNPSLPIESVADLISYAKAHPGTLTFQLTKLNTWTARIWQMLVDLDEAISTNPLEH